MKIEFRSRWDANLVIHTQEIPDETEKSQQIKKALRDADLQGADLQDADLQGADLRDADLRDADLQGADLQGADLRGADLQGADLQGADLRGADLRDADLRDADLRDADLQGADLQGADLQGADLRDADLREFKSDLIAEILKLPGELEAIRDALVFGKIDGTTYSTEGCSCLAGTIAKNRGIRKIESGCTIDENGLKFQVDVDSPRERWFMNIKTGDTPETNQCAAEALDWVNEAIAMRDHIVKFCDKNKADA